MSLLCTVFEILWDISR